jgi:TRAP-type C4-dicarboxylate transport system permease small subunit
VSLLSSLEKGALAATRALSVLGLTALMGLATMTLVDGLLRWLANRPIAGVRDLAALTIAVAVACSLPVVLIERGNITIRLLDGWLGGLVARVLDVAASLLVCGILALMAWQFEVFASKLALGHETTWVLQIQVAPFWYGVDVIFWGAVLVQAIVAARDIARLAGIQPAAD